MELQRLFGIALRVSFMYCYALALLRLSGRRTLRSLSPHDFVMTAVMGDMFDNIFWAQAPLSQGLVAMSTVVILQVLISFLTYRSPLLCRIVEGRPTPVVRDGQPLPAGLRAERLNEQSLEAALRLGGIAEIGEVREARLETDGALSVYQREGAQPADRRDLPRLKELLDEH